MTAPGTQEPLARDHALGRLLPSGRARWFVVTVLIVSFAARVGVVVATRHTYRPTFDALDYDLIASSLSAGQGYGQTHVPFAVGPTALRAPGYPASLALVYVVFGAHSWTWGRIANAGIGTGVVALIGLLASMVFGRRVGAIALLIAAVHPTLILYTSGLQLEPLLVLFELATLAAVLQHRRSGTGARWLIVAGATLGLGLLTREVAIFLLPPTAVLLAAMPKDQRWRGLRGTALVTAVAVLVVVPWTIRNAVQVGGFQPVTSGSGYALAGTYNQTSRDFDPYPAIWLPPTQDPTMRAVLTGLSDRTEPSVDRALRAASLDYIREHPEYVADVVFWNSVRLFDLQGPGHALYISRFLPYPRWLTRVSVYASYVMYALALLSLLVPAVRRSPKGIWLFPLLAWIGFSVITANIRYRASIEPFLVILAAASLAWTAQRWWPAGPATENGPGHTP